MSLVGIISEPGFQDPDSPYTVTRYGTGSYVDGRFIADPAPTTFTIVAGIQPATPRDLKALPEGQHAEEIRVVYTTTSLRTRNASGASDVVTYKGEPWTVIRVESWEGFGETFNKAWIARQTNP